MSGYSLRSTHMFYSFMKIDMHALEAGFNHNQLLFLMFMELGAEPPIQPIAVSDAYSLHTHTHQIDLFTIFASNV